LFYCSALYCQEYHGKYTYDPEGGIFKFNILDSIHRPRIGEIHIEDADSCNKVANSDRMQSWRQPAVSKYYTDALYSIGSRSAFLLPKESISKLKNNTIGMTFDPAVMRPKSGAAVASIMGSRSRNIGTLRPYYVRPLPLVQSRALSHTHSCAFDCKNHTLNSRWAEPSQEQVNDEIGNVQLPSEESMEDLVCLQWQHLAIKCNALTSGNSWETFYFTPTLSYDIN